MTRRRGLSSLTPMKALLLYPEFSALGFWNYKDVCHLLGAKYPASPLGLITMAALPRMQGASACPRVVITGDFFTRFSPFFM